MFVEKQIIDNQILVKVNGSIDVETSPSFRKELADIDYKSLKSFTFDFEKVSYVSSAGLRELLIVVKKINKAYPLKILNVNSVVEEIFVGTQFARYFEYTLAEEKPDFAHLSFKEFLAYKIKNGPEKTILSYLGKNYNWQDIDKYSQIIADDLAKKGVKKGSHVALCGSNSANWIFTFYAIQKLGAIAQLLSFSLPGDEIIKFAKVGDITFLCYGEMPLVTDEESFTKAVTGDDSPIKTTYSIKNNVDFSQRLNEYDNLKGKYENKIESDQPCAMIFTSGSTGVPKGVLVSAYNILNAANSNVETLRITKEDKACLILPLFHIFGLVAGLFANAIADAEMVIPDNIKTANLIKVISENKCTIFHSVPTMLLSIVNNKDFNMEKLSSLRATILSGAPVSEAQMIMLTEKFSNNHFISSYGLSEMAPVSTTDYDDTKEHISKTIGKPVKDIQIRIFDKEKKEECPVGVSGEIQVQGYNLMTGYYNVDIFDQSIDDEGWLHTGDLGYFDEDGYIHFDEGKMLENLKTRLAKYKIPAHFFVYDSFPSLPNGKVDSVNLKKDVIRKVKEESQA